MFDKWQEKLKAKNLSINDEEEIEFKNLDEATEAAPVREEPEKETAQASSAPSSIEGGNIALKVVRPEGFDEVSTIADYLIEGCTVVLNTELIDRTTTIRMLDFLNGVTYTKDGEIKNVAPNTYIITPNGIDIRD